MPIIGAQGSGAKSAPVAPTIGTATDVGTSRAYNNGAATVTFTAPTSKLPISSYTVTSSPGGYTGTGASSPITVTGLQSATAYTFTVTATSAAGTSPASSASNSITATTVPQAPTIGAATAGNASATVTYTAGATGGNAVSAYTATSSPGSFTGTGASPITVSGLSNGTGYTFTVTATNANGTSTASSASNSATPVPPKYFVMSSPLDINPNYQYSLDGITWTTGYTGQAAGQVTAIKKVGNYYYTGLNNYDSPAFVKYSSNLTSWTTLGAGASVAQISFNKGSSLMYAFSTYIFAGYKVASPYYLYMYTSSTGTGTFTENAISTVTSTTQGQITANSAGTQIVATRQQNGTFYDTTTSPTSGWTTRTGFPRTTYGPYQISYANGYYVTAGDDGFSYSSNGTTFTAATGNQDGTQPVIYGGGGRWIGGGSSGKVWTSTNLSNWTSNIPVAKDLSIGVNDNFVVAMNTQDYGSTTYYTSATGTGTWTTRTSAMNQYGSYTIYS
jgi:hypothetical protein